MSKKKIALTIMTVIVVGIIWLFTADIGYEKVRIQYLCSYEIEEVEKVGAAYVDIEEMIEIIETIEKFRDENEKKRVLNLLNKVDKEKGVFFCDGKKIRVLKRQEKPDLEVLVKTKGRKRNKVYLYTMDKNIQMKTEFTFIR